MTCPHCDNSKPVVALDIDGTLGDYHQHFLNFAEGWLGRPMPDPAANTDGVPLYRYMKVSKRTYRECKLAYRQGGMKRNMPVYEGAADLTRLLRRRGAEVWICTTRPYLRLDNIDPDTRHWLKRNRIQYDAVLYGEHKYRDLARSVGASRIVAVMDDLPPMCKQAVEVGARTVLLRDQPYNQGVQMYDERVHDMSEAERFILKALETWRNKND